MVKTLGILGGMGPLATASLFTNIVNMTDAKNDQDHIPIIINNNVLIPDRTDYILGKTSKNPKDDLIKSAKSLEQIGADFIIIPCNTAHYFYNDILKSVNIPVINMIDLAGRFLQERNITDIGLLATEGTIKVKIYDKIFEKYNVRVHVPSRKNQKYITEIIYGIKEDRSLESLDGYNRVVAELTKKGADVFVAGCTEMSVAIGLYELKEDIIDPMDLLARESIKYAGKKIKKEYNL